MCNNEVQVHNIRVISHCCFFSLLNTFLKMLKKAETCRSIFTRFITLCLNISAVVGMCICVWWLTLLYETWIILNFEPTVSLLHVIPECWRNSENKENRPANICISKIAYFPENRKNYRLRIIMQLIDIVLCIVSSMGISSYASKREQACAGSSLNPGWRSVV
jgi:hypothetical protein